MKNYHYPIVLLCVSALASAPCLAQGIITTAAGTAALVPDLESPALAYPIGSAAQITVDRNRGVFIADSRNNVVLRLDDSGVIRLFAGNGIAGFTGDGGPAINASLSRPVGVAVDGAGNVLISDSGNNRVRRVSPSGIISTVAGNGQGGFGGDGGRALDARIGEPGHLAIDSKGSVYVVQPASIAVRRIAPDGVISTIASNLPGGPAANPVLGTPFGVAVDSGDVVYFSDSFVNRMYRIGEQGAFTAILSGQESGALAFDAVGRLYVGGRTVRRLDPDGAVTVVAGNGDARFTGDGGPATAAGLTAASVAFDRAGALYIADSGHGRIRFVDAGGIIRTIAGNGFPRFFGDGGPAPSALLDSPAGMAFDVAGALYFADQANHRVRRIALDGTISTVAGNGNDGFAGDGGPAAAASLFQPAGVALDALGNLYIADQGNHRIRRIDSSGRITTIAGDGIARFAGDGQSATSASLQRPSGVALDAARNIYIADTGNHRVRVITSDGVINTLAGDGAAAFKGDGGPARAASLSSPAAVAVAAGGEIYISDTQNHRVRAVRGGVIRTVAGVGQPTFGGDDGPASAAGLNRPAGLTFDGAGNLYFADSANLRVRAVTPEGIISTVAGNGQNRFAGDGGLARRASLSQPLGVAVDAQLNIFVADTGNQRIRKTLSGSPPLLLSTSKLSFAAKAGGAAPAPALLGASSTVPELPFASGVDTAAGSGWLTASPAIGTLPAVVEVSADPAGLAPGAYEGSVRIGAPNATPAVQSVAVSFLVQDPGPPTRIVEPDALTFTFVQQSEPKSKAIRIANLGGGQLDFDLTADTGGSGEWLALSSSTGSAKAGQPAIVTVTVNPGVLSPGVYVGAIRISNIGAAALTVPITVTITEVEQTIRLSQSGLTFTAVIGGGVTPLQGLAVLNTGRGLMSWSAQVAPSNGPPWLTVSPDSGSTDASSLSVPSVIAGVNHAGLAPGEYFGQIVVSSTTALNSPQYVGVVLNVLPAGSDPGPILDTNELIFTSIAGAAAPSSKDVLVSNLAARSVSFRSSSVTLNGGAWLVYLPTDANIAPDRPGRLSVGVDTSGLAPGVYRGTITLQFGAVARKVSVLLFVIAPPAQPLSTLRSAQEECVPKGLFPSVGPVGAGFNVAGGWPTSLIVGVYDDCGLPMLAGLVVVTFSNGDPSLTMENLKDGRWSGTWSPGNRASGDVTLTVTAQQSRTNLRGVLQLQGGLVTRAEQPSLDHGGIVNAAGLTRQAPLAPGTAISIFGNALADVDVSSPEPPLADQLGGVSVLIAGRLAPIQRVTSSRIDAIVPYGLAVNTSHQVIVARGSTLTTPEDVTLAAAQPALFTKNLSGRGQGDIRDKEGRYYEPGHAAKAGDTIVIRCTGLGAVDLPIEAGTVAPADPPARVVGAVSVSIGGIEASKVTASLAPGKAGIYIVEAQVPDRTPRGDQIEVVMRVANQSSAPVTMAVE